MSLTVDVEQEPRTCSVRIVLLTRRVPHVYIGLQ